MGHFTRFHLTHDNPHNDPKPRVFPSFNGYKIIPYNRRTDANDIGNKLG